MEQLAPHLDLQRTFEACPPGSWRSREPTLRRGATSSDLVCCGFSTPLTPCFPACDRRVRGPASEICTVGTRTVSLFNSFSVTSCNIPCENPLIFCTASSSSFFSIIAADFVFPQIADFVANCALRPEAPRRFPAENCLSTSHSLSR